MLLVLCAAALVGLALVVAPMVTSRRHGLDEVARFHRARHLTTEWSRAGVTRPVFADDAADAEHAGDSAGREERVH